MKSKADDSDVQHGWPMILVDTSVLLADPDVLVRIVGNQGLPFLTNAILKEVAANQANPNEVLAETARSTYRELESAPAVDMTRLPNGRAIEDSDSLRRLTFRDCPVYVFARSAATESDDNSATDIALAKDYRIRIITRDTALKSRAEREGVKADLWTGPQPNTSAPIATANRSPESVRSHQISDAIPAASHARGKLYREPSPGRIKITVTRIFVAVAAVILIVVAARFLWNEPGVEARYAPGDETLIMRTKGGVLEVSWIRSVQTFTKTTDHTIFWVSFGKTISKIRVPAYFRYHIELAPEWPVRRNGDVFTVIAPNEKPTLPVAVDLALMEKEASGVWSLLTGASELEELQKSITAALAQRAMLPRNREMQREYARKTVAEFVQKWLLTHARWASSKNPTVIVKFADEE